MKTTVARELISVEKIRNLRRLKNWSQEDMASLLGVSVTTISRWESKNNSSYPTGTAAIVLGTLIAILEKELSTRESEIGQRAIWELIATDKGLTVIAKGYALYKVLDDIFREVEK